MSTADMNLGHDPMTSNQVSIMSVTWPVSVIVAMLVVVAGCLFLVSFSASSEKRSLNIKEVPDVIEREAFRRFSLLPPEICTYCGEGWRQCSCKMSKNPAMFQNRQDRPRDEVAAECLKYGLKYDK